MVVHRNPGRTCAMPMRRCVCLTAVLFIPLQMTSGDDQPRLVLQGKAATASFALNGGGLIEFRLSESSLNPLNWEVSPDVETIAPEGPRLQGHFLCLDRWGAPSVSEASKGIPFHGEAPRVVWQIQRPVELSGARLQAALSCELPLAGMKVERQIELESTSTVLVVTERVTNTGRLGRIYNMVQHPSIAPPFLDDSTIVDSNAQHGFSQDGPVPASPNEASLWPQLQLPGEVADLRHFKGAPADGHDVSSFTFGDDVRHGWVTACNPGSRLLLGYLWQTADYPWLNIWRYRHQMKVAARGLEFGTTGYHQPFPVLVRQHHILDRPLYEYLDVDETQERSYVAFLAAIPEDFCGVSSIRYADQQIQITETKHQPPRTIEIPLSRLPWD